MPRSTYARKMPLSMLVWITTYLCRNGCCHITHKIIARDILRAYVLHSVYVHSSGHCSRWTWPMCDIGASQRLVRTTQTIGIYTMTISLDYLNGRWEWAHTSGELVDGFRQSRSCHLLSFIWCTIAIHAPALLKQVIQKSRTVEFSKGSRRNAELVCHQFRGTILKCQLIRFIWIRPL